MEFGEIPLEELNTYGIISKTNALINDLIASPQDWCMETLLDIVYAILHYTQKKIQESKNASVSASTIDKISTIDTTALANLLMIAEGLVDDFEICIQQLSSNDSNLVEKAVQCLFVMLQLFGTQRVAQQRQIYFVESHTRHLLDALGSEKILVKKRVLKCILFGLDQDNHPMLLSEEQKTLINNMVGQLVNSHDKSVATTSAKIIEIISS